MTDQTETPNRPTAGDPAVDDGQRTDGAAAPAHDARPGDVPPASVDAGDDTGGDRSTDSDDRADGGEGDAQEQTELDPELRAAEDPRSPGQLLVALEDAVQLRDEYLDGLQRSRAEFDNYRRRTTREAAASRRAGVGDLAASLLEVLDDLDRTAEVASSSSDEGLAAGIGAVHRKLVDALVAAGLERVDQVDVPFDATRHEAVQQVPADGPVDEPQVAQVLRPGYVHGERCLRPAMVVVRQ